MDATDVAFVMFFVLLVVAAVYAVSRSPEAMLTARSPRLALAPNPADELETVASAPTASVQPQVVDAA